MSVSPLTGDFLLAPSPLSCLLLTCTVVGGSVVIVVAPVIVVDAAVIVVDGFVVEAAKLVMDGNIRNIPWSQAYQRS